jgi:sugar (glycoside-pentoside-hexuronide) transporter
LRAERLSVLTKVVYATGDHTVNLILSAASLLYLVFLTDVVGLRPALAAAVVWVARVVDAFSDPGMGRISDLTRWKAGRRRPYFLIGAIPLGLFFALMWLDTPLQTQSAKFAYYAAVYVGVCLAMTCVSVPYLALMPEMATDYDERTSINAFRAGAAVLGTLGAVAMKPLADGLGGDAQAWQQAGMIIGVWLVMPWLAVYAVSFERPEFQREAQVGFAEGARILLKHRAYRCLAGFYILARIAVDLLGVMLLFYFTHWLGRASDFGPALFLFLSCVVLSLPIWLRVAKRYDKRTIFMVGAAWWVAAQFFFFLGGPEWPRWTIFLLGALTAVGYAVADLMPWAMLGDVIDEDELAIGERREGVYVGFFTFLRKLGGASAVLVAGVALDLAGYEGALPREEQTQLALTAIGALTAFAPALFLAVSIWVAKDYPLSRAAHQQIVAQLRRRGSASQRGDRT